MKRLTQLLQQWHNPTPKGLKLPDYKALSNHDGTIKKLPIFSRYYVSLLQRDGEQAIPVVTIGDNVKAGDIIAKPTSPYALYRHAPTSGTVSAIVDICETHPSAMTVKAIEITADGLDNQTEQFPPLSVLEQQQNTVLLTRILHAGIAGMGGAGFPAERKINLGHTVETLIINGAECEPYITCDDLLMRHHADAILRGAQLFAQVLSATRILIGIEDNKPDAVNAMRRAAEALADTRIAVHVLPTQYPMGSRYQIAHALLGKKPDVSRRSHQSGFVCHNVATAKAAYDAVVLGKPSVSRLVTLSGDGVTHAGVYHILAGTTLRDVAAHVGFNMDNDEVVFGGTMMGFAAAQHSNLPQVIKRETTSVLAFKAPTKSAKQTAQNCIRCGYCADVCPMDLLPQQLQFYGSSGAYETAENNRLFDCIECGLCTYVCPSEIPLVQIFQHSKGEIIAERRKKADAEHARVRFETRNNRLAAEKAARAEKAAQRRAKLKQPEATTTTSSTKQHAKQDLIAAALARTQAKKAQHDALSQTPIKKPEEQA